MELLHGVTDGCGVPSLAMAALVPAPLRCHLYLGATPPWVPPPFRSHICLDATSSQFQLGAISA